MLLRYCKWFQETVQRMLYKEDWYQIDEAVMTMVQRQHPECFDFYYGDYTGIVANYLVPNYNHEIILAGLKKCMAYGETEKARLIRCFLSKNDNEKIEMSWYPNPQSNIGNEEYNHIKQK